MNNLLKRIEKIEASEQELITNVYTFNPKEKTVYREYGNKKIYMNWDEVITDEYVIAETIFAAPNYSNPNWESEKDGLWKVCVQGITVINENNI